MKALKMTEQKVVSLPSLAKPEEFKIPLAKLDSFEGIKAVAELMRKWERKNKENTFKLLAIKANLSKTTVLRIKDRVTMLPRLHTILSILGALGFSMVRFD